MFKTMCHSGVSSRVSEIYKGQILSQTFYSSSFSCTVEVHLFFSKFHLKVILNFSNAIKTLLGNNNKK